MAIVKTATKKPAKPAAQKTAGKAAPKPAKKVTLDDVWAGFRELQIVHKEARKETEKDMRELRAAHKEAQEKTEKDMNELRELHKETEKAIKETQAAHKETEKTLNEIGLGHNELRELHKETEKTLNKIGLGHNELRELHKETEKTLNKAIHGVSSTLGSLVEHIMTPGLPRKFEQFGFTFDRVTTVKWAVEGSIYTQIDGLLENGNQAMVVEVKTTLRQNDIDEHLERMEKVRKYADSHGDGREFLGAIAATITDEATRKYALKKGFFVIEPSGEDVKITKPPAEKIW